MTFRDALVLRVAALWGVFTWAVFVRNILADHTHHFSAGFKAVHVGLAVISVVFAFAVWAVASVNRRDRHRAQEAERAEARREPGAS